MSHLDTDPDRVTTSNHRAHVLAEAVVSAYIDEIARSARPRQRVVSTPSRRPTARTHGAAHSRSRVLTRRGRPVASELGA
ncbi:hypothetical protein [Candidatus Solirubrobacter pratensis]|uniref:hypothetical protein n=1 Tax=Candidatus Solirubrobacter pratensis TaxID=1298857 RepID=UPI00042842FD|nr:hypothetical protein [Candidatus Solirubrobacter pratensis]